MADRTYTMSKEEAQTRLYLNAWGRNDLRGTEYYANIHGIYNGQNELVWENKRGFVTALETNKVREETLEVIPLVEVQQNGTSS